MDHTVSLLAYCRTPHTLSQAKFGDDSVHALKRLHLQNRFALLSGSVLLTLQRRSESGELACIHVPALLSCFISAEAPRMTVMTSCSVWRDHRPLLQVPVPRGASASELCQMLRGGRAGACAGRHWHPASPGSHQACLPGASLTFKSILRLKTDCSLILCDRNCTYLLVVP